MRPALRGGLLRVLAGVMLFGWASTAYATPLCAARFVVQSSDGDLLAVATDVAGSRLAVVDGTLALDDTCVATALQVSRTAAGWRLVARWRQCGARRGLTVHARVTADCEVLAGRARARGHRAARFTALRSRCGDGVVDAGGNETCDDGNVRDGDACSATCAACDPSAGRWPDTWAGLQSNVIDRYACTNCHGALLIGGLDLRAPDAYAHLVGVPASGAPDILRIAPGDAARSLVWLKLAKGVYGGYDEVAGGGMPSDGKLTVEELDAVAAWIAAGAPASGVVPGTDVLRQRCRPR